MRLKPLTLLTLLGAVRASAPPDGDCTARAWVRAPDLVPDSVVRGDARVKISTGCPAIETVVLGLRLKERSLVKALRFQKDREWQHPAQSYTPIDFQRLSPWDFTGNSAACPTNEVTLLANKDLWVVREEERLVFETTQLIQMTDGVSEVHDVVQDFAILVPSTNFPPGLDYAHIMSPTGNHPEIVDAEFIYEYFILVQFENGTTKDISAGVTSFQPHYDPADTLPTQTSATTVLEPQHIIGTGKDLPTTNYTAQVTGLVFTEDSEDQFVTVVITRIGPARTFAEPLMIETSVEPSFLSKWAVEYGMPSSHPLCNPEHTLRSMPEDVELSNCWSPHCHCCGDAMVSITMHNSTSDEVQSGEIVTTSATITIPVKVARRHVTNFETYYQTLANSLRITLTISDIEDETVDQDDPSADDPVHWEPEIADDEEPWVPMEKNAPFDMQPRWTWATYTGSVPVIVRPVNEVAPSQRCIHAGADTSQLVLSDLSDGAFCEQHSLLHYLDDGARGPTFVDPGAVHELLAKDPVERELHAPFLEPVVSSVPEGEEIVYRYHRQVNPRKPLIYVGETWVKKVVKKGVVNKGEPDFTPAMDNPELSLFHHMPF